MPLFRDPDRRRHYLWSPDHRPEQPTTGSSGSLNDLYHQDFTEPVTKYSEPSLSTKSDMPGPWANDREELIHRIKESSPWRLQPSSTEKENGDGFMPRRSQEQQTVFGQHQELSVGNQHRIDEKEELGSPADIQRPRSALHSGDFREGATDHHDPPTPRPLFKERNTASPLAHLGSSPTTPWFGATAFPPLQTPTTSNGNLQSIPFAGNTRTRAPSLGSFSSSYVLKAPTSPLVYQANNTDLDFSPRIEPVDVPEPSEKANRRRTLPPETFRNLEFSPPSQHAMNIGSPCPPERQKDLFANQNSHPRRSLTSAYSLQLAPSPAGQFLPSHFRRPSLSGDNSSKPHAPMVGSYEESILRGRMSMNPSKPLDFTAQIGVLGKGKCKGHLKCPPHVTVPFPVVFYSYPTSGSGRSISDDNPSPYVGQIDLENSLPKENEAPARRRRRHTSPAVHREDTPATDGANAPRISEADSRRRREKKSRRSESPKCPPGGSYRIPQQGQLQIIIKNPHKTAVKLFLVPYDLGDMEPGTKTFIRQRSYSAGPIIDMPLSARKNFGTDRPEASLNATEDPQDKPTLRYLIHLNICCPSRGRFYLHSSIRVVFANRVPDGKEKLRNEIQNPEPRYSPYKPSRDSSLATSTNARMGIEKASRRRSVGQGAISSFRPQLSSPGGLPSQLEVPSPMDLDDSSHLSPRSQSAALYNKLTKDDVGYGGHPYISSQSGQEVGESLLAKRLRGLDVHRTETPPDEHYPHAVDFHNRFHPSHNHHHHR